jgi:hypothetical protein
MTQNSRSIVEISENNIRFKEHALDLIDAATSAESMSPKNRKL